ncbi:MAG: adventurous gliding motility protein GltG [Myxococcales bacterium]|nr:adventurous gliding motility protein GltG [Myxococcales bacterium]
MAVPLTLKVYKGDELIATKDYDRDIIKIGRLSSAHLCLDDDKVSRIHSVIEVGADGALSIIDMGSVEGTYVNGKRVNKGTLAFGDEIKVGNTTIKLESPQAAAAAAASFDAPTKVVKAEEVTTDPNVAASLQAAAQAAPAPVHPAVHAPAPVPAPAAYTEPAMPRVQDEQTGVKARAKPRRRKGSGPLGLELRFMWGDQMVGEYFLKPGVAATFTVGSAPGVHFLMGDSKFGGPKFEVVKADAQGYVLRFTQKMKGELHRGDKVMELRHAVESRIASSDGDGYGISLQSDDFACVDLGGVTLEVFFQPVPKPVLVPLTESIDFTALNIFLVMFFLGALFVISALNRELEGDEYLDELSSNHARIAKLIIKPPEIQKNPLLEKLAKQKQEQGEMAAKHRGDEGQMGRKDAPKRSAHAAPKGDPNNKDQARMLAQKIFGSGGGGISTIFGHNGLGGELKAAMGNMFGAAPGDAHGFGGLGLRGTGSGGGGVGDTIGIGGIGTKGRGGGTGSYGSGVGVLGGKKGVDIGITSSEPMVMGSLDKELIRQVIRANRQKFLYCYESQLTRFPKLQGKVAVKFVISASGSVASSQVAQSTANNAELETCVAGRMRTLVFPKPKGGGVVIVTYPFIFKPSGE